MAITYGIDLINSSSFTTTYQGFFISPLYQVGTNKGLYKFTEMEVSFDRVLRTNEGVKIEYRLDTSAAFTTLITIDYATYGAILSKNIVTELPTDLKECEQIQIKCSLTGTTTTPSLKNITLK